MRSSQQTPNKTKPRDKTRLSEYKDAAENIRHCLNDVSSSITLYEGDDWLEAHKQASEQPIAPDADIDEILNGFPVPYHHTAVHCLERARNAVETFAANGNSELVKISKIVDFALYELIPLARTIMTHEIGAVRELRNSYVEDLRDWFNQYNTPLFHAALALDKWQRLTHGDVSHYILPRGPHYELRRVILRYLFENEISTPDKGLLRGQIMAGIANHVDRDTGIEDKDVAKALKMLREGLFIDHAGSSPKYFYFILCRGVNCAQYLTPNPTFTEIE